MYVLSESAPQGAKSRAAHKIKKRNNFVGFRTFAAVFQW
jgi:hypothetical protein